MRWVRSVSVIPFALVCALAACKPASPTSVCDGSCEEKDAGHDAGPVDSGPPPCAPGLTLCSGACTDITADLNNCGQCGTACGTDSICESSSCATPPTSCPDDGGCPSGSFCNTQSESCLAGCQSDSDCTSTQICSSSACVTGCRADMDCPNSSYVCSALQCVLPCTDNSTCTTGNVCNTNNGGHCQLGDGDGGMAYPAPFATPPQVINETGPVLANPKLVPIFFPNGMADGGIAGDRASDISALTTFTNEIGGTGSTYWGPAMSEWGVGPGTATAPIDATAADLAGLASGGVITDGDIQSWIGTKLADSTSGWPAPDANTLYVIYFPAGITVTIPSLGGTSQSCQEFGGYHSNLTIGSVNNPTDVAYAVVPRCPSFGPLMGIASITGPASHEIAEGSSDPYPQSNPAFADVDTPHLFWEFVLGGGEIGDMCAQDPSAFTLFPGFPFTVQRIWSNKAALAGSDPCLPEIKDEVYFNSAIEMNDLVTVNLGRPTQFVGAHIPIGVTKTIPVDLFSEGPISQPWTVQVLDWSSFQGGPTLLTITQDKMTGLNGDKIQATITPTAAASSAQGGLEFIFVTSTSADQMWEHFWVGVVGN